MRILPSFAESEIPPIETGEPTNVATEDSQERYPLVYVLILNWNGKLHLRECFDSLFQMDYPNFRVVMIDNGSVDGSVEYVEENYPSVEIIVNQKNLGFAEGNNVGIRWALSKGARYIALLNNDTKVDRGWLSELVQVGDRKEHIGILGGKVLIYNNPKMVNSTGVHMNYYGYAWDRDFAEYEEDVPTRSGPVLGISGAAMLIRRDVFEETGLLDPSYFAYYEDLDLCIRTWVGTQYTVEYIPSAVIYHKFSASSGDDSFYKHYLTAKNHYRIVGKFYPIRKMVQYVPKMLFHRMKAVIFPFLILLKWRYFFTELFLMTQFLATLPWLKVKGALETRGDSHTDFWAMLIPAEGFPIHKELPEEYARIGMSKNEITQAPARILMGINDDLLGDGWLPLVHATPRYRRFIKRASCFLKNNPLFDHIQIHCMCEENAEFDLHIFIENEQIYSCPIHRGWETYVVPFKNHFAGDVLEVVLEVVPVRGGTSAPSLAVNEIGLFPGTSRLLRSEVAKPLVNEETGHA